MQTYTLIVRPKKPAAEEPAVQPAQEQTDEEMR